MREGTLSLSPERATVGETDDWQLSFRYFISHVTVAARLGLLWSSYGIVTSITCLICSSNAQWISSFNKCSSHANLIILLQPRFWVYLLANKPSLSIKCDQRNNERPVLWPIAVCHDMWYQVVHFGKGKGQVRLIYEQPATMSVQQLHGMFRLINSTQAECIPSLVLSKRDGVQKKAKILVVFSHTQLLE